MTTEAMETRVSKALRRMILMTQNVSEIEEIENKVLVFKDLDDDVLVFCMYDWTEGAKEDWIPYNRTEFEKVMVKYLITHQLHEGAIRVDIANLMVVGDDRAMVRYIKDYKWEVL